MQKSGENKFSCQIKNPLPDFEWAKNCRNLLRRSNRCGLHSGKRAIFLLELEI
jgi:hypothetical protein